FGLSCVICLSPSRCFFFCFLFSGAPRDLHSLPTRRSSDLFRNILNRLVLQVVFQRQSTYKTHHQRLLFRSIPNLLVPLVVFQRQDRKSTRLNSSHVKISYAVFCLKKKKQK